MKRELPSTPPSDQANRRPINHPVIAITVTAGSRCGTPELSRKTGAAPDPVDPTRLREPSSPGLSKDRVLVRQKHLLSPYVRRCRSAMSRTDSVESRLSTFSSPIVVHSADGQVKVYQSKRSTPVDLKAVEGSVWMMLTMRIDARTNLGLQDLSNCTTMIGS